MATVHQILSASPRSRRGTTASKLEAAVLAAVSPLAQGDNTSIVGFIRGQSKEFVYRERRIVGPTNCLLGYIELAT